MCATQTFTNDIKLLWGHRDQGNTLGLAKQTRNYGLLGHLLRCAFLTNIASHSIISLAKLASKYLLLFALYNTVVKGLTKLLKVMVHLGIKYD